MESYINLKREVCRAVIKYTVLLIAANHISIKFNQFGIVLLMIKCFELKTLRKYTFIAMQAVIYGTKIVS